MGPRWLDHPRRRCNFVLQQTDGTWPNLLINEIGAYQGSVPFMAGPSLLLIKADGAWTIATS